MVSEGEAGCIGGKATKLCGASLSTEFDLTGEVTACVSGISWLAELPEVL